MKQLDRFFRLSQRGTTLGRELRGGCTTFCSMVYLILVIPGLLSGAGMDFETVMTATCLIAAAGSIVSGLVSNLPFALAPGLGFTTLFTHTLCQKYGCTWQQALALVLVSLLSMLIGFVDDFIKVVKKRNLGLIWWQKIIGQVLVSVAFSLYCYFSPLVGSSILVPFFNVEWDLGVLYVPLMTLTMIFMINSANLQDGLDGLLSSVTVISSAAWGLMAVFVALAGGAFMSPELLAQVSDPFTTTRTTRKMGLGIPLLRMAVEQTGGSLTIDSTEGVGTTVTALFRPAHIDCPPVGDMAGTITLLLQGTPQLELHYVHTIDNNRFQLTTEELRAQLGPEISLAEPEVILWIRDYLQEQEMLLRENKGMKA